MKPSKRDLEALARRDPRLGRAMARVQPFPGFPGLDQRAQRSHFHALARAILFQQLHWKAATTIHDRVVKLTPGSSFPDAAELSRIPSSKLRSAGVSRNKELALRDLAEHVQLGKLKLNSISKQSDEDIVESLTAVRGIGPWTVEMFLMFRLGRLDVMPTTDLGIQEGLRILDRLPERPAPKYVLERSKPWRPIRSVASWVLYRLVDEERERSSK